MKPSFLLRTCFCAVLSLALFSDWNQAGQGGSTTQPPRKVTMQQVLAAWQARQDRVHSAKFTWIEKQTYTKGAILGPDSPKSLNREGLTVPPEDITYDAPHSLSVDGEKMRYAFEQKDWVAAKSTFVPQGYIAVFDGSLVKILSPPGYVSWPVGTIPFEKQHPDAGNVHARSVLATYRPLHPTMGLPGASKLLVSGRTAIYKGRDCLVLEESSASSERPRWFYWVDAGRDFTLCRASLQAGERVSLKLDIDYALDGANGWVPTAWQIVQLKNDGSMRQSFSAKVTSHQLNLPIPAEEFQLDFPPGTVVNDRGSGKEQSYIVRDHGDNRPILLEETGATYEQIVSSEPGRALQGSVESSTFLWKWLIAAGSALAILVGVAILRRYRTTPRQVAP